MQVTDENHEKIDSLIHKYIGDQSSYETLFGRLEES